VAKENSPGNCRGRTGATIEVTSGDQSAVVPLTTTRCGLPGGERCGERFHAGESVVVYRPVDNARERFEMSGDNIDCGLAATSNRRERAVNTRDAGASIFRLEWWQAVSRWACKTAQIHSPPIGSKSRDG